MMPHIGRHGIRYSHRAFTYSFPTANITLNMNRIFFILTAFFALLSSSIPSIAYDCKVDGIYYDLNNDDKTASVTYIGFYSSNNKDAYVGNIIIPKSTTYNGTTYSVTSIGNRAFHGCSGLTSVTIPNSVTSIGEYAFYYCSGLTSVTIPNSVTSIGYNAFADCSGLTSVTIPNSVTSIGSSAFSCCSGLTSVTVDKNNGTYDSRDNCNAIIETSTNKLIVGCNNTIIPNSVTAISEYAFFRCSGLTSVTIPNSVTSIGDGAFCDCTGLTFVSIPNSVTSIGYNTFYYCSGLTSVTIPNSITSIGEFAFYGCSGLTSVTIGNSVTTIGEFAFYGCSGLTSVTIPNSVTSIGNYAFYNCSGLTSVTIPNSVTSIGYGAFANCSGLTSVTIPNSVTFISEIAFGGCSGLTSVTVDKDNGTYDSRDNCNAIIHTSTNKLIVGCNNTIIPNSVTSIGDNAFLVCSGLTSVTIPNSVTSIGKYAFYNCSGLTSVTIPNSVTSIGYGAFGGCSGLTSVTVDKNNGTYDSRDNCNAIIETSTNKLIVGCKNTTIPNSVTSIGDRAFEGCSGLTSVTIGNSVTSIGKYAFAGCWGLTSVTIGNSVTSIGDYAFTDCSGLTSVTIGNSVTSIGYDAFRGCSGLTKLVSLAVEPPICGRGAFEKVDKTTCQLLVPEESINKYKTADQWKEFLNILGYNGVDDVSVDSQNAVYEVYNLQGVRVGIGMREAEVTADALPHGVYILVSPQGRKKIQI